MSEQPDLRAAGPADADSAAAAPRPDRARIDGSVVALGGGHGLAAVLASLAGRCDALTAVVSVADDGGSSGALRRDLGIVAPGDMRRCLDALTPPGLLRDALAHRFADGDLAGHTAGNVVLAAMLEQGADPQTAMDTLATAIGARGRVLPASLAPVDLIAETAAGEVRGQMAASRAGDIEALRFVPENPEAPPAVIEAIAAADLVTIGPGSLYTSVLAALTPAVRGAVSESDALVVYIANLTAHPADEAAAQGLSARLAALQRHGVAPDLVLAPAGAATAGPAAGAAPRVVRARLAGDDPCSHDPRLLGPALCDAYAAQRRVAAVG